MIIKELSSLSKDLIEEIRNVEAICKKFDGLDGDIFLDTSFNFNKEIKSVFLIYEEDKLISLIFLFIPTRNEAEISAFTLPEYRNKGYFNKLYTRAIEELKKYGIHEILLVCETKSSVGKIVVNKLNSNYDFTEYFMKYPNLCMQDDSKRRFFWELVTPGLEDLDSLITMSRIIFNESYEDSKDMILNTFESRNRLQYAVIFKNNYIGMASVCFEEEQVSIYGLGILPEYQGKGLGKELLLMLLKDLEKRGHKNITLEVNSKNQKAFKLYKDNGFLIDTSVDYYRKSVV